MTKQNAYIARVQAWLTFVLVLSFIVLLLLGSLGYAPAMEAAKDLKEFTSVAVLFWLMRQRPNGVSTEEPETPAKKDVRTLHAPTQ